MVDKNLINKDKEFENFIYLYLIELFDKDIDYFKKEFEKVFKCKIIYISYIGSKLFGTDDEKSDRDYVILYIPTLDSIILEQDLDVIKLESRKGKNRPKDIDINCYDIRKFLYQIGSGSPNFIDYFFSFYRSDTILYEDKKVIEYLKSAKDNLITNKNINTYLSYYKKQEKKFIDHSDTYNELKEFKRKFIEIVEKNSKYKNSKLKDTIICLNNYFSKKRKGVKIDNNFIYVMNKKFDLNIRNRYFIDKLNRILDQFSHRVKNSSVDYKALSHAYRSLFEFEQLIKEDKITFPLKEKEFLKDIKRKRVDYNSCVNELYKKEEQLINFYNYYKIKAYNNREFINKIILKLIKENL